MDRTFQLQQGLPSSSIPMPSITQPSSAAAGSATRVVVTEEITTVKVPMLRPKPALLKVLRLGGGVGETFTLAEIINHVKDYIKERTLYDEQDPRIVHCGGDLLAVALGVNTFTVNEAIDLFSKNCSVEPDSCIRIHRHLVRRAVSSQDQAATGSATVSGLTRTPHSERTETVMTPTDPSSVHLPASGSFFQNRKGIHPQQNTQTSLTRPESVTSIVDNSLEHGVPPSLSSASQLSSSLQSPIIKLNAAEPYLSVTDSDLERSHVGQIGSPSDSSCDEETRNMFRGQHRQRGSEKSSVQPRGRSTSINVTYDEPDGATGPWVCEVRAEISAGEIARHENEQEMVEVEFDSDAFSVEYDVESDSESDIKGGKPAEQASRDSSESSSTSGAAFLVVCQESDVEYLADYSDSDNDSNPEFSDADKWKCEQCNNENPPFQRNCGGCWSVRPDWLPSTSKETEDKACNDSQETVMSTCVTSQSQSLEQSQESFKSSQEQSNDMHKLQKSPCAGTKNAKSVHRKRKFSSSFSTSDSQDGRTDKVEVSVVISESKMEEKKNGKSAIASKDGLCVVCLTRRRTASIVHGKIGHQACCYRCARKLKQQRKSCPICRRPIQKVIRNYL